VFTPTARDEIRTLGWIERSSRPFDRRLVFDQRDAVVSSRAGHAQSTWEHGGADGMPVKFFAAYTRRQESAWYDARSEGLIERLTDGPVAALAALPASPAATYRWSVGARAGSSPARAAPQRNVLQSGIDATGGGTRIASFYSGDVRELVDGIPARVWRFQDPGRPSFRHEIGVAAFASDRLTVTPGVHVDAGIRLDSIAGKAEGAAAGIRWTTLLPQVGAEWMLTSRWEPRLFARYTRTAYHLPLDWLAFGDPAAPTTDVFRWEPGSRQNLGALIARTGPGTGGRAEFVTIDPALQRPLSDEIVVGVDVRPNAALRFRLAGTTRAERHLVDVANTGPVAYAMTGVFDPGGDVGSSADDRIVPVFNRLPDSFGTDRYQLTNLDGPDATFEGIQFEAEIESDRLTLMLGATAGRAETPAANRGFGPLENDQGLLGERAVDPNAATFARGRPFTDRAYTAKLAGVYRLPTATTLGVIARYQDGQPFSRMLVVRGLNQGPEAVRAFASGDSRFMFIGTLDARLQQRLTIGSTRLDLVLDVFNLPGLDNSVEERVAEAPDVRVATALQPPRTFHVGLRFTF
jgi:hypothetical protein